jgi:hypothetical protein
MSDETRRVLDLLAQGKITVDEADQLLRALTGHPPRADAAPAGAASSAAKPRFIRIHVHKPGKDGCQPKDVNIRVPISVVRGGMRLGTMIPGWQQWMGARVRDRGVDLDFSKLDPDEIESLLGKMGEIHIDSGSGEQVRITTE